MDWIVFLIVQLEPVALSNSNQLVLVETGWSFGKNSQLELASIDRSAALNLFLQIDDRANELLWSWWTTWHVHIYRHKPIDPLNDCISVKNTTRASTRAHRNTPFRLRHLQPNPLQNRQHFHYNPARHNHKIALPRGEPHDFATESRQIMLARSRAHQLDATTGSRERHRPQTIRPCPGGSCI